MIPPVLHIHTNSPPPNAMSFWQLTALLKKTPKNKRSMFVIDFHDSLTTATYNDEGNNY
jgi:hypothetical protein